MQRRAFITSLAGGAARLVTLFAQPRAALQ